MFSGIVYDTSGEGSPEHNSSAVTGRRDGSVELDTLQGQIAISLVERPVAAGIDDFIEKYSFRFGHTVLA